MATPAPSRLVQSGISIVVVGLPIQQGSTRSMPYGDPCKVCKRRDQVTISQNQGALKKWNRAVVDAARAVMAGRDPWDCPVALDVTFYLPRTQVQKLKGGGTRTVRLDVDRPFPDVAPDLDKLNRAIGDALKRAGVLTNDARIVDSSERKRWEETAPGARIRVAPLQPSQAVLFSR